MNMYDKLTTAAVRDLITLKAQGRSWSVIARHLYTRHRFAPGRNLKRPFNASTLKSKFEGYNYPLIDKLIGADPETALDAVKDALCGK